MLIGAIQHPARIKRAGCDESYSVVIHFIRRNNDCALRGLRHYTLRALDTILKKIGEEATETVIAAKGGDKAQIVYETADLWFHTLVLLAQQGLGPDDVLRELERRWGTSGVDEKAARGK